MSRRSDRVGSLIRNIIGQLLLTKLADPRIDPARTSVTRVSVPEDLLTAKVFISVMGSDSQQRNALRGLRHAAGHIQSLLRERVDLRYVPVLTFEIDQQFKKTVQTLAVIQQAMDEIRQKEQAVGRPADPADEGAGPVTGPGETRG